MVASALVSPGEPVATAVPATSMPIAASAVWTPRRRSVLGKTPRLHLEGVVMATGRGVYGTIRAPDDGWHAGGACG